MDSSLRNGARLRAIIASLGIASGLALCGTVNAQQSQLPVCSSVPCNEVHTVAADDQAVPLEYSLAITSAGSYKVTLTDLGAQAPLNAPVVAVMLAITDTTGIVGTPLTAAGNMTFAASPGTYLIHITGKPGTAPGSGIIGITVTSADGSTQVATFSGTLALPATALPSNESVVSDPLSVMTTDTYQVTLTDLSFPQALQELVLAIFDETDGVIVPNSQLAVVGPPGLTVTQSVTLQQGVSYRVVAAGLAPGQAGLFSASVNPASGPAVYSRTVPIGSVLLLGSPNLDAESYTLVLADLQLPHIGGVPSPLAQVGAMVTLAGAAVATLEVAGSQPFQVAAGATYQVFATGTAGASGGSYAVTVQPATGPPPLSVARAVSTASVFGYSYDASIVNAGAYAVDLTDFNFPAQFKAISVAAVQGGVTAGPVLTAPGSQSVNVSAGALTLLVFAQPDTGGGLFAVDLTASGSSTPTVTATQGVGQLVSARQFSISTPGTYSVTVNDLAFPAAFANLAAVVTQGTNRIASIFGAGTFNFAATPGSYTINLLAQPGGTQEAGTYQISVGAAPAAPTVSLQADASTVDSGGSVHLIWSSQGATSCTASGGWSGTQATSGTAATPAIFSSTTFTLTCTGAGGSANASVTVSVQAASKSGGGGAIGCDLLALLLTSQCVRLLRRARSSRQHS